MIARTWLLLCALAVVALSVTACSRSSSPLTPGPAELGYQLAPALPTADFDKMLGFALVPDEEDRALIATQDGFIWKVALDGSAPAALFGDVTELLVLDPGNEEGLLGLAFSPDYAVSHELFLFYTAGVPGNRRSVISRFDVVDGALDVASERVLLEVPQPFRIHNGGQLAFGPDGMLYIGIGEGGGDSDASQDLSTLLGSILRIEVTETGYVVPPDNPFVDTPGAAPEIYAYGLRNPWRFAFDRATGDLWAADVGADLWEETDRIVAGGNYGWDVVEGPACFDATSCDTEGLLPPRSVYSHEEGCAVIGGFVYRGAALRELTGWYVYGDLCSGNVWAVNTAGDAPPVLLAETGRMLSSFGELPDGELIALTYGNAVYRLERAAPES